jgi:hypothetical protein
MASPFRQQFKPPFKSSRAGIRVNLGGNERGILVQLLGQLDDLLDDGSGPTSGPDHEDPLAAIVGMRGTDLEADLEADLDAELGAEPGAAAQRPEDPAVARLLPDANRDDPQMSAEFRRLTEYGLRARKRSGARLAARALSREEPVVLATEEALALLKSLTDVRLVLGERLELRTDKDAERLHDALWAGEGSESFLATASIYELLTSWQEHLVLAVSRSR